MYFAKKSPLLLLVLLHLLACHGRSATPLGSDTVTTASLTGNNDRQADEAVFSCLIDGQPFASSGTDGLANAAMKTAPDIINFALVGMDPRYKNTVPPQMAFYISPSGTTNINGVGGKYSAKYSPAEALDNDYVADHVTVIITSLTATRIKGTFSGKFSSSKKSIEVTQGKFDLPASKYSKGLQ